MMEERKGQQGIMQSPIALGQTSIKCAWVDDFWTMYMGADEGGDA